MDNPSIILFATPKTVACQAPLSVEFSGQEYWSELPFPSPGHLPKAGIEPRSPALQGDSLPKSQTRLTDEHFHFTFTFYHTGGLAVKNLPAKAQATGDLGSIPGSGRCPGGGNGNPLQYSCLGNPMDRGAWQATYSPWGHKEWDMTERQSTHMPTHYYVRSI